MDNYKALEVFLRGFSTTRSFTKPYGSSELSPGTWLLADIDPKKGHERTSEVITYRTNPEEVIATVKQRAVGRHYLCALVEDASGAPDVITAYKARGYRLLGREPLFVLETAKRVRYDTLSVHRITDAQEAAALAKAARSRQILAEHLTIEDSVSRFYAAFDGDVPVGWVRSIRTHPDCAWVAGLFVQATHRRKGIGRALMTAMLDDDAHFGVEYSVLLASQAGSKLYPLLGYKQTGLLLLLCPVKVKSGLPGGTG